MEISFDPPLLYQKLISLHTTESGNISALEASLAFFSNVFSSLTLLLPVAGHHTGKAPHPPTFCPIFHNEHHTRMTTEDPTACLHLQCRAGMLKGIFYKSWVSRMPATAAFLTLTLVWWQWKSYLCWWMCSRTTWFLFLRQLLRTLSLSICWSISGVEISSPSCLNSVQFCSLMTHLKLTFNF